MSLAAQLLASILVCQPLSAPQGEGSCQILAAGIDTSCFNNTDGVFLGEGLGQTFMSLSQDIRRITVWREAQEDTNVIGIHLFIVGTDSLGAPDVSVTLLNGPSLVVPYGDGVHPIRFDFAFNPPFHLPKMGTYCFAMLANPCWGTWDLECDASSSGSGDYPGGCLWLFGRSDCYLRPYPLQHPSADLIFEIDFCQATTPVISRSWGQIKSIYR